MNKNKVTKLNTLEQNFQSNLNKLLFVRSMYTGTIFVLNFFINCAGIVVVSAG